MSAFSRNVIRTLVPLAVGVVIALLAKAGFHIASTTVTAILAPVITAVYYVVVRKIEEYVPRAGWLLGVPLATATSISAAASTAASQVAADVNANAATVVSTVVSDVTGASTTKKSSPSSKTPPTPTA